ncbi:hypothetical protein GCM10027074_54290 [Streptomyces deserti]
MRRRSSAITTAVTIVAATAAVAVLTGCTSGPGSGEPAAAARPAEPVRELTQAEQARLGHAEERLIQRCMADEGFRYWVDPPPSADTLRAFTRGFVLSDVAWAREHGYGEELQRAYLSAKKRDRNLAYRNSLSPTLRERYVTALSGGPESPVLSVGLPAGGAVRTLDGGCRHVARAELYGDTEAFFRADKIATNLTPVYTPKLVRDKRFTAALRSWSDCMHGATGRRYADPDAVRTDLHQRIDGLDASKARAVEVGTAVAEATCAQETGLRDTLTLLDRTYGDPVRERHAEEIATSNRMKLTALRRADRIGARG